jgi:hypothetical protein
MTVTAFTCVKLFSIPSSDHSFPKPLCLNPPDGVSGSQGPDHARRKDVVPRARCLLDGLLKVTQATRLPSPRSS